jgi:hypothetical protein
MLMSKAGAYQSGVTLGVGFEIGRLGRKLLAVTNALAYYDTELNVAVKSFIARAPGSQTLMLSKHFFLT